jgi:hypothetical protein
LPVLGLGEDDPTIGGRHQGASRELQVTLSEQGSQLLPRGLPLAVSRLRSLDLEYRPYSEQSHFHRIVRDLENRGAFGHPIPVGRHVAEHHRVAHGPHFADDRLHASPAARRYGKLLLPRVDEQDEYEREEEIPGGLHQLDHPAAQCRRPQTPECLHTRSSRWPSDHI